MKSQFEFYCDCFLPGVGAAGRGFVNLTSKKVIMALKNRDQGSHRLQKYLNLEGFLEKS